MAKTALEVITHSLRKLNVIGSTEAADGDTYADALAEYQGFHDWLELEFTHNLSWSYNEVPDEYWVHVAGWFTGQLSETIPASDKAMQRASIGAARAETRLREMLSREQIKRVQAEYY